MMLVANSATRNKTATVMLSLDSSGYNLSFTAASLRPELARILADTQPPTMRAA